MTSRTALFKKLDHLLGLPLCMLVSLWCALWKTRRPVALVAPQAVLVIKFFGLGSIGYSTVIARDLKREFPGVRVDLLTFRENRSFTELLGCFDRVVTVDPSSPLQFLRDTAAIALRHLLTRPYDVCIDLEFFSKYTTLHAAMTRARQRIGFYSNVFWRRHIYTHPSYFNTAKHVRRIYGLVSEVAGVKQSEERPVSVPLPPNVFDSAAAKLRATGCGVERPVVGVNVNASDLALGRRWPIERFAELADALARAGFDVGLTGSKDEREYVDTCVRLVSTAGRNRVFNLAGVFSLVEFLAFLKSTSLFVTNDSGPMILAILVDAPTISIWGPGDPAMYGGSSPLHTWVYSNYPCSPCMYVMNTDAGHFCNRSFACIDAIGSEAVLQGALRRLGMPAP